MTDTPPTITATHLTGLTLSTGERVSIGTWPNALLGGLNPEGLAYLQTDWRNPTAPAYYVPADLYTQVAALLRLRPTVVSLQGATIERAALEGEGCAALTLRLCDGGAYTYRLPVPVPYALAGSRSAALTGQPYRLTLNYDAPRPLTLLCPDTLWPSVMAALTATQ